MNLVYFETFTFIGSTISKRCRRAPNKCLVKFWGTITTKSGYFRRKVSPIIVDFQSATVNFCDYDKAKCHELWRS